MVNDRDTIAGSQQSGIFDLLRPVGIHDYEQRAGVRRNQRFLRREEDVLILRFLLHSLNQRFGCVVVRFNNNLSLDTELSGKTADTDIRSHRVQIRKLVSHHEDL